MKEILDQQNVGGGQLERRCDQGKATAKVLRAGG